MSKSVRSRRQIFGIPAILAVMTLIALVVGLTGGTALWPLTWVGTVVPLAVAAWCMKRTG